MHRKRTPARSCPLFPIPSVIVNAPSSSPSACTAVTFVSELVVLPRRTRGEVPRLGKQGDRRISVHVVAVDDDGQVLPCEAVLGKQRSGLRRTKLEKLVRLRRPREEITQAVMPWLEALTDDPYRRADRAHSADS